MNKSSINMIIVFIIMAIICLFSGLKYGGFISILAYICAGLSVFGAVFCGFLHIVLYDDEGRNN